MFYVIAKVEDFEGIYAIKEVNTHMDKGFSVQSSIFRFGLDKEKPLFIGRSNGKPPVRFGRVEFSLAEYKSKINENFYKLDLKKALGRIAYGCEIHFLDVSISKEFLLEALNDETLRQDKLNNPSELFDSQRDAIEKKYQKIEESWLTFWKNSKLSFQNFYDLYKIPIKQNFQRRGLGSAIFGGFDEAGYNNACIEHRNAYESLLYKLGKEAKKLKNDFSSLCPNGCKRKLIFSIEIDGGRPDTYGYTKEFPHRIYKKIHQVSGSCPECGSFAIKYKDDNWSCISLNHRQEYLNLIIHEVLDKDIAWSFRSQFQE